jgi:hypothetical protein
MNNQLPEADELALWSRTSKNGKQYLSGIVKINGQQFKVVAFPNQKTKDTQPDYSFKKPTNQPNQQTNGYQQ